MAELFNAGIVSARELAKQRECAEYLVNKRLRIHTKDTEAFTFYKSYVSLLMDCNNSSKDDSLDKLNDLFQKEYSRNWFDMDAVYEAAKEKELSYAVRLFESFFAESYDEIVAVNVPVSVAFNKNMEWRGVTFNAVRDCCDFIAKKDGILHAVKICYSMPYSMKARKEINKPYNSIELCVMCAGLIEKYPNMIYEQWSIKNSTDKTDRLAAQPGKITYDFKNFETRGAVIDKLFDLLAMPCEQADCDSCRYKSICCIGSYKKDKEKETVTESGPSGASGLRLTPTQEEVAGHMDGPMVVVAVPGSGKTACLVERCVRLKNAGVSMRNVLLVSFTKKATRELQERLTALLGEDNLPNISTLNSLGNDILIKNAGILGKRVKLADETDCKAIIDKCLAQSKKIPGLAYLGREMKWGLVSTLYKWFEEIDSDGESNFLSNHSNLASYTLDGVLSVYRMYRLEYERNGYISYDDQIDLCNQMFREHPNVPVMMSKLYKYIMVDEYQDINEAQAKMIDTIAMNHNNIVVVGDDDQSIYSWRGGSNEFMLNFDKRYEGAVRVTMSDNFRSTEQILSASQELIHTNDGKRFDKIIVPHKNGTNKPCLFKDFQAPGLARIIEQAEAVGFKRGDIAVIARKNKTLSAIATVLEKEGIQCTSPKDYLIDDIVYKGIMDILSLTFSSTVDDLALCRLLIILGVNKHDLVRGNAYKTSSLYEQLCDTGMLFPFDDDALWDAFDVKAVSGDFIENTYLLPCKRAGETIYRALKAAKSRRISCIRDIATILFGNGSENHPAVKELLDMADERAIVDIRALLTLMENCERFSDSKRVGYAVDEDTVNLLTAHDSKGKEFPFVIVYGIEDYSDDEEGIRLLYVAITRAKKSLFLTESPFAQSPCLQYLKKGVICR